VGGEDFNAEDAQIEIEREDAMRAEQDAMEEE
jgi:hypothetical protein